MQIFNTIMILLGLYNIITGASTIKSAPILGPLQMAVGLFGVPWFTYLFIQGL